MLIKDPTPKMKSSSETTTRPSKDTIDSKEEAIPELTHSSETGRQRILSSLPYPWQPIVDGDLTSVNEVQLNQKYQGILDNYQSLGMQEGLTQLSNDLDIIRSIAEQLASNNDFGLCHFLTDGLNRLAPIEDFWEHCFRLSNTTRTYSSSHPQHQLISTSSLPEKGAQAAQQEAIREEFNQDVHRNLEITAYSSRNKLVFHARVRNGGYQFLQYRNDKLIGQINFKLSNSTHEDDSDNQINKRYFSESCQSAIMDFAEDNSTLAMAIQDLTTQTADNTLWLFFDLVYRSLFNIPSPLSSVTPHCRTGLLCPGRWKHHGKAYPSGIWL